MNYKLIWTQTTVRVRLWPRGLDINSEKKKKSPSTPHSAQTPSSSPLRLDRIQTRQVKKSSHTSCDAAHLCRLGHAALPSNPGSALMSGLLWRDLDRHMLHLWGEGEVCSAEQRRHISVALYADGLVKQSYTSRSVSLFPPRSREERSWSSEVWTCILGLRTVSPLWEHTALPWPPHPAWLHLFPDLVLRMRPVHRA